MKRKSGSLIVLAVAIIGLIALNPTMDDFKTYQKKKTANSVGGLLGKAAGEISTAFFDRTSYGIASVFYTGKQNNMKNRYLGIAKIFISLDSKK